jgi:hypothetical protein
MQLKNEYDNESVYITDNDQKSLQKYFIGQEIREVKFINKEEIILTNIHNGKCKFYHDNDCCEDFYFVDFDLEEAKDILIGNPIIKFEIESNSDDEPDDDCQDSYTWTYIKISTIKGTLTIRGFGTSNGYYSEEPDIRVDKMWFALANKKHEINIL